MLKKNLIIMTLLFCITACAKPPSENRADNVANSEKNTKYKDQVIAENETLIKKDAEELIEVHLIGGEATVYFKVKRWQELFDTSQIDLTGSIYKEEFKIEGIEGKIKDVFIGQLEEYDFYPWMEGTSPTIFLLLEDGSLEYLSANMLMLNGGPILFSHGPLPWIRDIDSFSYENDGEGIGKMTLYAHDSKGVKYDLAILGEFINLATMTDSWVSDMYDSEPYFMTGYYGALNFFPDGQLIFERGWAQDEEPERYIGNYSLSIAANQDKRPGILTINLYADPDSKLEYIQKEIHGEFFAHIYDGICLELYHSDGDSLHLEESPDLAYLTFWIGFNPFDLRKDAVDLKSDEDYSNYLIRSIAQVKEMLEDRDMSILVTEEYEDFGHEYPRLLWLGTNHENQFVRELLYAITENGIIYEYDPLGDAWIIIWMDG